MLKFSQHQIDAAIVADTERLSEIAADELFAKVEFYSIMPFEVRKLLAETAIADARAHGMDTLDSIFGFVEVMAEMTPRFSVMPPFRDILARVDLSADDKMRRIMSDEMAPAWVPVLKHIDAENDWHQDYWDERVDWNRVAHLQPTDH